MFLVSSIPATPPCGASTTASHHIKCALKQERARKNHVKRPTNSPILWEDSTQARLTALPPEHAYTHSGAHWIKNVNEHIDLTGRRADFATNFNSVCDALAYAVNPDTGTLRITWNALAKLASTSITTVQRILRILKEHQLLTVIASGRSAAMAPKFQEKKNLAPVYGLILPASPSKAHVENDGSFYDENGYLFVSDCPSPLRDEKVSYKQALAEGTFDIFCKQRYAAYAKKHRGKLEKKRQTLLPFYPRKKDKQRALIHLSRTLQHHCFDLRALSAQAILKTAQPFWEAGWSVRDILYALEYRPDGAAYNTRGATGMRSVKKWLDLRLSQWTNDSHIFPSRTAQENAQRVQPPAQHSENPVRHMNKTYGPSPEVKRQIKVALLGEKKARHLFPELF